MSYNRDRITLIVKLLSEVTSLEVISEFLREHDLPHSGLTWENLLQKRILPALDDDSLTESQLIQLLRDTEEHGRNHVFLYACSRAQADALMQSDTLQRALKQIGVSDVLVNPRILDQPQTSTVTDVRIDSDDSLTATIVETRQVNDLVDEKEEGEFITKTWRRISQRAVNVAKLRKQGLLEIRIQSHANSSKYQDDLNRIRMMLASLLPLQTFTPVSLGKAKKFLLENRDQLRSTIRHSDSTLRNDIDTVLTAATGRIEQSLFDDKSVSQSLDTFLGTHHAYCETSNIWCRKQPSGVPSKDVHVLLSGMPNEFAIPAHCVKQDYEHVLAQLLQYNR